MVKGSGWGHLVTLKLFKDTAEGLGLDDPSGFQFRPSEFFNCEFL